jgi:hypothetical protein
VNSKVNFMKVEGRKETDSMEFKIAIYFVSSELIENGSKAEVHFVEKGRRE